MDGVPQSRLSRRKLMVTAMVTAVAGCAARGGPIATTLASAPSDPVLAKAVSWVAANAQIDAMSAEADKLQGQVFKKAKELGITRSRACRRSMPEARRYRALNKKVTSGYRDLEELAGQISTMSAMSAEGALAKIELALNIQGPFDWRDHVLEIAESGIAELRQLIGVKSVELPQMSEVRERMERSG